MKKTLLSSIFRLGLFLGGSIVMILPAFGKSASFRLDENNGLLVPNHSRENYDQEQIKNNLGCLELGCQQNIIDSLPHPETPTYKKTKKRGIKRFFSMRRLKRIFKKRSGKSIKPVWSQNNNVTVPIFPSSVLPTPSLVDIKESIDNQIIYPNNDLCFSNDTIQSTFNQLLLEAPGMHGKSLAETNPVEILDENESSPTFPMSQYQQKDQEPADQGDQNQYSQQREECIDPVDQNSPKPFFEEEVRGLSEDEAELPEQENPVRDQDQVEEEVYQRNDLVEEVIPEPEADPQVIEPVEEVAPEPEVALQGVEPVAEIDPEPEADPQVIEAVAEIDPEPEAAHQVIEPVAEIDPEPEVALQGIEPVIEIDPELEAARQVIEPVAEIDPEPVAIPPVIEPVEEVILQINNIVREAVLEQVTQNKGAEFEEEYKKLEKITVKRKIRSGQGNPEQAKENQRVENIPEIKGRVYGEKILPKSRPERPFGEQNKEAKKVEQHKKLGKIALERKVKENERRVGKDQENQGVYYEPGAKEKINGQGGQRNKQPLRPIGDHNNATWFDDEYGKLEKISAERKARERQNKVKQGRENHGYYEQEMKGVVDGDSPVKVALKPLENHNRFNNWGWGIGMVASFFFGGENNNK